MEQPKTERISPNTPPCDSCGSFDTETVNRTVGTAEKLTLLLYPVFIVFGFILGFFAFIFGLAMIDYFGLGEELTLIGCSASFMLILPVGGGVLAKVLGTVIIRKRRRKLNLSPKTYRCKACGKVFVPQTNI